MMPGLTRVTESLWVLSGRSLSYNAGVFAADGEAVLIDPGMFADEVDRIRAHVYGLDAEPRRIVITHSHWDHVLGPEYFPGVPVTAHAESVGVRLEHALGIERQVTEWESENCVGRELPFVMPEPDQTFADELTLGGLRLIHTPGHAPEALVVWSEEERVLWAGDMLSDIEIPFVMQSCNAYQATLERLARFDVGVLVPGHGAATKDPAEIRQRFFLDRDYLAELLRRITRAVQQGWSAGEALAVCADMKFRRPESNARPHQLNVESTFLELGGAPEPGHEGWNRFM